MKTQIKTLAAAALLLTVATTRVNAQDSAKAAPPSGELKYIFTGDAFFGFKYVNTPSTTTATFNTMGYNPVILYRLSDRLFFEGELEFQTESWMEDPTATSGNATGEGMKVEMEFANMNYVINKYMTFRAGIFFTPYGIFEDWYHQRITNRFVSRPLGIGHGGIEPGADEGVELNGGIPMGTAKLHYAVALLNGAKLITQQDDPASGGTQNIGNLEYENIIDNNSNKAYVARIGILPFSNNCLEIGGWYGNGIVGAASDKNNSSVQATHAGAYLSFVKDLEPIKGTVTIRSQYSTLSVGDMKYTLASDTGINIGKVYTFNNNNSNAFYAQFCYRPTMIINKYVRRFEIGVRYGAVTYPNLAYGKWIMPGTSKGAKSSNQLALVLDYWLKWNAVIKVSYEQNYTDANPNVSTSKAVVPPGSLIFQFAMGL